MEKREKILVIDDSSVQADMLRSILEGDYDVTVVHTAEAGLHHARPGFFREDRFGIEFPARTQYAIAGACGSPLPAR